MSIYSGSGGGGGEMCQLYYHPTGQYKQQLLPIIHNLHTTPLLLHCNGFHKLPYETTIDWRIKCLDKNKLVKNIDSINSGSSNSSSSGGSGSSGNSREKTDVELALEAVSQYEKNVGYYTPPLPTTTASNITTTTTPHTQKLAFLFITRGPMIHEKIWRHFFNNISSKYYNIYTHVPTGYSYSRSSVFVGTELPVNYRQAVKWGK